MQDLAVQSLLPGRCKCLGRRRPGPSRARPCCRHSGITDCPVTAMAVTRCDGRDSTDTRDPPICTVAAVGLWPMSGTHIGDICEREAEVVLILMMPGCPAGIGLAEVRVGPCRWPGIRFGRGLLRHGARNWHAAPSAGTGSRAGLNPGCYAAVQRRWARSASWGQCVLCAWRGSCGAGSGGSAGSSRVAVPWSCHRGWPSAR